VTVNIGQLQDDLDYEAGAWHNQERELERLQVESMKKEALQMQLSEAQGELGNRDSEL